MTGAWVAAGIAALVSAGAGYENNRQVAKKQDNTLAAQLRRQGELQQQANQKTSQLIQKTAGSDDASAKSGLLQSYLQEMQQKSAGTNAGLKQVGNVSSAFTKAANDAALGVSQYGNTRANLVSAIDAPGLQRQGEAADLMQYGTDVGGIKQQSAADEFLANIRLRGIKANPWLTALQSAAGSYAKSRGGSTGSSSGSDWSQGNTTSMGGGLTANLPNY